MKNNSVALLRSIPPLRRTFSAISIALSFVFALAAFGVQQGTSWTYQGQLRRSGAAYTGTCDFQFTLWTAVSAGTQQNGTQSINSVSVVNGLFTVELDFGDAFKGEARWLGTSVQCSGDGGFTPLEPRQPITSAPYALSLRPGASIIDYNTSSGRPPALFVQSLSTNATGLAANGKVGVYGSSVFESLGTGVKGFASGFGSYGVDGYSSGDSGIGIRGTANGANAAGVFGQNDSGLGVGVWGNSIGAGDAIYGQNTSTGLAGRFVGPVDVAGVFTVTTNSTGVNSAIYAHNTGTGYAGRFFGPVGVAGGIGVTTNSTGENSAIYGENTGTGYAGRFVGPVKVQGTLTKSAGSFQIDHPLDPANKFLSHSFVESPDMKNIYDGNVTTDASGSATVTLPDYFAALNRDFRYQLTVLGQFAQAIVSTKIAGNTFEIRTDKPGVEVSWQVTGIRQDAYAKGHPIVVEEFKPAEEKGLYLYPAGFGAGEEKGIGYSSRPVTAPGSQEASAAGSGDQSSNE